MFGRTEFTVCKVQYVLLSKNCLWWGTSSVHGHGRENICHLPTRHWGTKVSHPTLTSKTIARHSCCGFHLPAKPLPSRDFVLKGKHLRVNSSIGMLADGTKCFASEEGQYRSSTAERDGGQCYTGPASQYAFLFQLRNVNSLLFAWCMEVEAVDYGAYQTCDVCMCGWVIYYRVSFKKNNKKNGTIS